MNLIPLLSTDWSELFTANIPILMFFTLMVVFVCMMFAGHSGPTKLLGSGLAVGFLGLIGITTGWPFVLFWTVVTVIGLVLTIIGGIMNSMGRRQHK